MVGANGLVDAAGVEGPVDDQRPEGALDEIVRIWRATMAEPTLFFRSVPDSEGIGPALAYALLIGVAAAAIRLFWSLMLPVGQEPGMRIGLPADPLDPLIGFLFSPVFLLLALFVTATVLHGSLRLAGDGAAGWATTFRVIAYSTSPWLLAVVPALGDIVGAVWSVVLLVIGARAAHSTSIARTLVALLLPAIAVAALVAIAALMLAAALAALGLSV